jgi:hypothetical protein
VIKELLVHWWYGRNATKECKENEQVDELSCCRLLLCCNSNATGTVVTLGWHRLTNVKSYGSVVPKTNTSCRLRAPGVHPK